MGKIKVDPVTVAEVLSPMMRPGGGNTPEEIEQLRNAFDATPDELIKHCMANVAAATILYHALLIATFGDEPTNHSAFCLAAWEFARRARGLNMEDTLGVSLIDLDRMGFRPSGLGRMERTFYVCLAERHDAEEPPRWELVPIREANVHYTDLGKLAAEIEDGLKRAYPGRDYGKKTEPTHKPNPKVAPWATASGHAKSGHQPATGQGKPSAPPNQGSSGKK